MPTSIAVPAVPLGTMALEATVEEMVVIGREGVRLGDQGVVQRGGYKNTGIRKHSIVETVIIACTHQKGFLSKVQYECTKIRTNNMKFSSNA